MGTRRTFATVDSLIGFQHARAFVTQERIFDDCSIWLQHAEVHNECDVTLFDPLRDGLIVLRRTVVVDVQLAAQDRFTLLACGETENRLREVAQQIKGQESTKLSGSFVLRTEHEVRFTKRLNVLAYIFASDARLIATCINRRAKRVGHNNAPAVRIVLNFFATEQEARHGRRRTRQNRQAIAFLLLEIVRTQDRATARLVENHNLRIARQILLQERLPCAAITACATAFFKRNNNGNGFCR